jgi:hypothetical protein
VEAAVQAAADQDAAVTAEPTVEELTADDIPTLEVDVDEIPVDEAPAPEEPTVVAPEPPAVEEIPVVAEAAVEIVPEPVAPKLVHEPAPKPVAKPVSKPVAKPAPKPVPAPVHERVPAPAPEPRHEPGVLNEFVSDLETSLGDSFLPGTVTKPVAPPAATTPARTERIPAARTEPVIAAAPAAPVLGEFVADIEASLGEDFLQAAPVAEPEPPAPVAKAKPAPPVPAPAPVVAPKVIPPLAASAAASASVTNHVAPPAMQSAPATIAPAKIAPAAAMASVAWHAPVVDVPKPPPPAFPASPAPASAPAAKASPFGEDAGVDLAEMFGELKHDLEADVASADEDPETHYNLGIAFREMGLLDEAIGELQKACQSFDHGHAFPQIMQTYTWLAQCFLEKGVPEAAVRWYDKALNVPGIDGETRVALHYELASAYETAGDKASALKHFMDVYGNNIDYRDVAERIKALKS